MISTATTATGTETGTTGSSTTTVTAKAADRFTTGVPRVPRLTGRAGPLGLALTAYELWRRLPPKQRQQVLKAVRKHGPKAASKLIERGRVARTAKRR
jgi:hypothetical protein